MLDNGPLFTMAFLVLLFLFILSFNLYSVKNSKIEMISSPLSLSSDANHDTKATPGVDSLKKCFHRKRLGTDNEHKV